MSWQIILVIVLVSVPLQLVCSLIGQKKAVVSYLPSLIFFIGVVICVLAMLIVKDGNSLAYIVLLVTFVVLLVTSLVLSLVFGRWLKARRDNKF